MAPCPGPWEAGTPSPDRRAPSVVSMDREVTVGTPSRDFKEPSTSFWEANIPLHSPAALSSARGAVRL